MYLYTHKHLKHSNIHSESQRLFQVQNTQQPPTNTHSHTHICMHTLNKSFDFLQGVVTSNNTQTGSSCLLQPANHNTAYGEEGCIRKSHVPLCTLDSSHDRLCFFLPVNTRNPLRSSGGDTTWGNNVRMDLAIVPHRCYLRDVRLWFFISG